MAPEEQGYGIAELARLTDATPRTIRYYVAQGLLPAPTGTGPGAHYTDDHLARLRLIRRLQRQHQPLAEIRVRLSQLDEAEVAALASDAADEPPADSALDYVRSLLAAPGGGHPGPPATLPAPAAPTPLPPAAAQAPAPDIAPPRMMARRGLMSMLAARDTAPKYATAPAQPAQPVQPPPRAPGPSDELRSQWDRIGLTPNIEIHVRRPLSRFENRRVERLIAIARQILREEQP
jgi:DNA-binding transcriptional MerR regulator